MKIPFALESSFDGGEKTGLSDGAYAGAKVLLVREEYEGDWRIYSFTTED
ncbi:MAG: hypothetical protein LBR54_00335 [Oscillospiraceae bacterium]|jgi:hypothetical protein|nr:hypothetical protein [Oscillospiraceae bacterium]